MVAASTSDALADTDDEGAANGGAAVTVDNTDTADLAIIAGAGASTDGNGIMVSQCQFLFTYQNMYVYLNFQRLLF